MAGIRQYAATARQLHPRFAHLIPPSRHTGLRSACVPGALPAGVKMNALSARTALDVRRTRATTAAENAVAAVPADRRRRHLAALAHRDFHHRAAPRNQSAGAELLRTGAVRSEEHTSELQSPK